MIMPFGKYKGKKIKELPYNYVYGLLNNVKITIPRLEEKLKEHLADQPKKSSRWSLNPTLRDDWDGDPYDDPYEYEGIPNS